MRSKCVVNGCTNDSDVGGDLICLPCFDMLVAGAPQSPGDTFVHKLQKALHDKLVEENRAEQ